MKIPTLAAVAATLILGTASAAQADDHRERGLAAADLNGDGVVSLAEARAQGAERFDRMDIDGDGLLTAEDRAERQARRFANADANNDGEVTLSEMAAMAGGIVEEFEDLGADVTLAEAVRVVAPVHLTLLKRALRNLVANAVRYGGSASVYVMRAGERAVLRVEDEGPGIEDDRIAQMMEPFVRGEASRNRATGGAGLGLPLARAIAQQHGGQLVLANRARGGLRAEIRLPLD